MQFVDVWWQQCEVGGLTRVRPPPDAGVAGPAGVSVPAVVAGGALPELGDGGPLEALLPVALGLAGTALGAAVPWLCEGAGL